MLTEIVSACFIGALLGLDSVSFGQFQLSRPVVTGAVIGYCLGDYFNGLLLGALLELIWAGSLPIGGHVPPDVTLMGILGVIWLIMISKMTGWNINALMVIMTIIVIPIGHAGNSSEVWLRRFNNRLIAKAGNYLEAGDFTGLYRLKWWGLLFNFTRILLLLLVFVLPVHWLINWWGEPLRQGGEILLNGQLAIPLKVYYYLLPALGLAALMSLFYRRDLSLFMWGGFIWGFLLIWVVKMDVLWYTIYTLGLVLTLVPVIYLLVVKKGIEWR